MFTRTLVAMSFTLAACGSVDDAPEDRTAISAQVMCQQFVEERLPEASTFSEQEAEQVDGDRWNASGVVVLDGREQVYRCGLTHLGGDRWELVDLVGAGG